MSKTRINALLCNTCGDVIFSRARHDFHWCSCKQQDDGDDTSIFVDGGFDYMRCGAGIKADFENITFMVEQTEEELYQDWNHHRDKYGTIKEKDCRVIFDDENFLAEQLVHQVCGTMHLADAEISDEHRERMVSDTADYLKRKCIRAEKKTSPKRKVYQDLENNMHYQD